MDADLAEQVAKQLMERDALGAHARDEIGITAELSARPVQAAVWSAAAFSLGAVIPVATAWLAPMAAVLWLVPGVSIVLLGILGGLAARAGGAEPLRGALRVCLWGTAAMGLTAGVGKLFGVLV